ncbi:hypothetical protein GGR50DRAFT_57202 [Xylaria sp. CBS 124048]|nr:hypothetical protein GGR50DRAFT_57202 [Xylaria sp. CBS 124048]
MSSSDSSSSRPPRTPQHGRTKSGNDPHQIRLVPHTPPSAPSGPPAKTAEAASHAPVPEDAINDPIGGTSTIAGREGLSKSALSSSSSSPIVSPTWVGGKVDAEPRLVSDSAETKQLVPPASVVHRTSHGSSIRQVNTAPQQLQSHNDSGPSLPSTRPKPIGRRNRVLSINSDKTFSIVLKPTPVQVSTSSQSTLKSYPYSNASLGSHEETSFDAPTDDHPSSLFSALPGRSVSVSSVEAPTISSAINEDQSASFGSFRMVGGLRQVPKTSDLKDKGKGKEIATEPLPTLPEATVAVTAPETSSLEPRASFVTEHSSSTLDETTNYKVIGRSSPPQAPDSADASPSSSSSNYRILGRSSAPHSIPSSPTRGQSVLDTPGSRNFVVHDGSYPASDSVSLETPRSRNYVVHGNASPSSWMYPTPRATQNRPSFDSFQQVGDNYSQESLLIAPLRTHRRSSSETIHMRQPPRESFHGRSTSYSSISSVLTEDVSPNVVTLAHSPPGSSYRQSAWTSRKNVGRPVSRLDVHQWSSQLSTVMSEYDDSAPGSRLSRRNTLGSSIEGGSSALGSPSLFRNMDPSRGGFQSHSRSSSLDRPSTVVRSAKELSNPLVPTVRDHDEHGDGLADLQQMHQLQSKSSRTRLGFLSRQSSDKSLHSSISSRSGSFTSITIPTWAKLYYGSGERRWLASSSMISEDDDGQTTTLWIPGGSSSPSETSQNIHNPRRRPRESQNDDPETMPPEAAAAAPAAPAVPRREPKKMTSSIWSPHLGLDHRVSRYDMWRPPSIAWSADNGVFGRRNIQVVLFALGFIFPFAWITAAFLPLPPKRQLDMEEAGKGIAQLHAPESAAPQPSNPLVAPADDSRYQSARWWRNVNRYLAIVGLFIIGAIIALIVIGTQQGWAK